VKAGVRALSAHYDQIELAGTLEELITLPNRAEPIRKRSQDIEYVSAPGHDLVRVRASGNAPDGTERSVLESVYVNTPIMHFALKKGTAGKYALEFLNNEPASLREIAQQLRNAYGRAPLSLYGISLADLVEDPSWVAEKAVEEPTGLENTVRVAFRFRAPGEVPAVISGWMTMLPRRSWALKEYEFRRSDTPSDLVTHGTLEYDPGNLDSMHFKTAAITRTQRNGGSTETYRFAVSKIDPSTTPPADFDFPAFGLPSINQTPAPAGDGLWPLALFALPAAFLLATIAFRVLSKRAERNAAR
jgi:hypothetical protein